MRAIELLNQKHNTRIHLDHEGSENSFSNWPLTRIVRKRTRPTEHGNAAHSHIKKIIETEVLDQDYPGEDERRVSGFMGVLPLPSHVRFPSPKPPAKYQKKRRDIYIYIYIYISDKN